MLDRLDLLDLLLPLRCVVCSRGRSSLCDTCRAALPAVPAPGCARCGAPTAWPVARCRECAGRRLAFARARAAAAYEGPTRRVMTAWKERGQRTLAREAAAVVCERIARPHAQGLAFVPADPGRRFARGHHPAERLAVELARAWELPCLAVLVRDRPAPPQRGLPRAERRRNVEGAFRATAAVPRRLVLVDDVYTTGATASAAASALRRAGAREVDVVTFARTIRTAGLGLGTRR